MVHGYPNGIKKKDIPYEAQIVRVADEYDAIVTKRQYTTHVNISETLKDLIKNAKPDPKFVALDQLAEKEKNGKINGVILKKLFKVVIDDTLYEISGIVEYIKYLEQEIKRLEVIDGYKKKAEKATKEKNKQYYIEGMKLLFHAGETLDNCTQILEEFRQALIVRKDMVEKLYHEIKIIKKLRI